MHILKIIDKNKFHENIFSVPTNEINFILKINFKIILKNKFFSHWWEPGFSSSFGEN